MRNILVAITGASGSAYALRLLARFSKQDGVHIHLVVSNWGSEVMEQETGKKLQAQLELLAIERLSLYANDDLAANISSGSFPIQAMVIVPCSLGTAGSIAAGLSSNLIERAAAVALKERRKLILVARESPLSTIHLQNLLTLSQAGAMILPPMPAFYSHPQSVDDILDSTVDRILDALGFADTDIKRWSHT